MAVEDSDVHARRNVLLLSASMLLAAWLKQDLPGVLAALGISSIRPDLAERVWVALFFVVLYLLARYHFSPLRSKRWAEGGEVLSALQHRCFRPWARRLQANRTNAKRVGKEPNRILIQPDVFGIPWLVVQGWRSVYFHYQVEDEEDESYQYRYRNDNCESGKLPWWLAIANLVGIFFVRTLLSRDGLEVAIPYWLACTAAGVAVIRAGWLS